MTIRLQSGAIPRKVHSAYVSILPELQSLQLNNDDVNYGGFSFVDDIMYSEEPKNFKAIAIHTNW